VQKFNFKDVVFFAIEMVVLNVFDNKGLGFFVVKKKDVG